MKLKPKKFQKGGQPVFQLGIGNEPDTSKKNQKSKVDLKTFFGSEEKPASASGYKMPYSKPTPHEVDAVLQYVMDKYKIKEAYLKKFPQLAAEVNKTHPDYNTWKQHADKIAKINPSSYLDPADIITDPNDLYLYQQAAADRQKFLSDWEGVDTKGTGPKAHTIGFRTITMPMSPISKYVHINPEGVKKEVSKKWTFTGKEFKGFPLNAFDNIP